MPLIDVRILQETDWRAFKDIRLEALKNDPEAFGDSYEEALERPNSVFQERVKTSVVIAAFLEGEVVGMLGYYGDRSKKSKHVGNIWGVYVSPKARGKGVSKKLFDKVFDIMPSEIEQVRLSVGSYNEAARKLYALYGFQECGIEEKVLKIGDEYIDEIPMVKFIK